MRRTALLAALVTAIVGGAATFAAADTAPTASEPAPDPYLGSWALMIDGTYAGPVASVDDCDLQADVVKESLDPDHVHPKHTSPTRPAPCTIEVGLGMSRTFNTWLSGSLAGNETRHIIQLVRNDIRTGAYALELDQARLATVTLPKIDRASTNPAFLKIALAGETLRRTSAPPVTAAIPRGFTPALLAVDIAGVRTDVARLGPWKAKAVEHDVLRDYLLTTVDVGNLPLRVTDSGATRIMDPWLQSFLVQGQNGNDDERSVVVTLTDGKTGRLELRFDHAGLTKGDLATRADGNRNYTLYAERVAAMAR